MADEQRIAVLEGHIRAIYEQIAALRAELNGGAVHEAPAAHAGMASEPATTPPPEPSKPHKPAAPRTPSIDLESLIGRYGTIAVASLAILMGVGTFLSWAIEHGMLGPLARVILGFLGAGVVAGVGVWVREKRDVRFGNVLLALSLAIVHVDAWAAGPHLRVIPTTVALAIAAVASTALAALALTSEERTLFSIGFAGAMIAPFVTSSEGGSVLVLLTYGWVIIASTIFAIRERGWEAVMWLTVLAGMVYVGAATSAATPHESVWLTAHAPILFAFACAAAALLFARDAIRSNLALAYLLIAGAAALSYAPSAPHLEYALPLLGVLASYGISRELETEKHWIALGNVIIPLAFLGAVFFSTGSEALKAIAALALTSMAGLLAWNTIAPMSRTS